MYFLRGEIKMPSPGKNLITNDKLAEFYIYLIANHPTMLDINNKYQFVSSELFLLEAQRDIIDYIIKAELDPTNDSKADDEAGLINALIDAYEELGTEEKFEDAKQRDLFERRAKFLSVFLENPIERKWLYYAVSAQLQLIKLARKIVDGSKDYFDPDFQAELEELERTHNKKNECEEAKINGKEYEAKMQPSSTRSIASADSSINAGPKLGEQKPVLPPSPTADTVHNLKPLPPLAPVAASAMLASSHLPPAPPQKPKISWKKLGLLILLGLTVAGLTVASLGVAGVVSIAVGAAIAVTAGTVLGGGLGLLVGVREKPSQLPEPHEPAPPVEPLQDSRASSGGWGHAQIGQGIRRSSLDNSVPESQKPSQQPSGVSSTLDPSDQSSLRNSSMNSPRSHDGGEDQSVDTPRATGSLADSIVMVEPPKDIPTAPNGESNSQNRGFFPWW